MYIIDSDILLSTQNNILFTQYVSIKFIFLFLRRFINLCMWRKRNFKAILYFCELHYPNRSQYNIQCVFNITYENKYKYFNMHIFSVMLEIFKQFSTFSFTKRAWSYSIYLNNSVYLIYYTICCNQLWLLLLISLIS